MHRGFRHFASLLLTAALATPVALMATPLRAQEREEHDRDEHRYYDAEHRDYHNWDDREDRAYRHWLEERHTAYREFNRLNRKEQNRYWKWRHEHEEHEEHEHH